MSVNGILDIVGDRAFVRADGYLPGPGDTSVPMGLVRANDLRRGDTVTGEIRSGKLASVDHVNGQRPGYRRPAFADLTPLYPNERLRLETEPHAMTARVTDLVMPVGKGQRALVVAPPKAGKTTVLQAIAHGIAKNHPECHLMLVLVGERPEEVTDLARGVPAEVVAATFDRPPREHTALAELATGRILTGGVDSSALTPPKRFLGAARNIEGGGSLTIFATALVETGSAGDSLIFEEFKGTSNAELHLDRRIADKRVFPAVDVRRSGTRKEELLLGPAEQAATRALRQALDTRDNQAIEVLLEGLRRTQTNAEFLAGLIRR
jgi:transcription termination factor Rho